MAICTRKTEQCLFNRSSIRLFAFHISALFSLLSECVPLLAEQVYPIPGGADERGFELIFNGKNLDGWEGDPAYWRVENGCLVGEVTPSTLLKQNTFIIWKNGTTRDF